MIVLCFVGQPSSGKDSSAHYLETKGFEHISSGNIIREEMTQLGLTLDRSSLNKFSITARKEHGESYPAPEVVRRISRDTVISGFRNIAEVEYLRTYFKKDFYLIAITAPLEARFKRAQSRNREGDRISFEQFKEQEDRERSGISDSHQLDQVIAAADYTIENSGTEKELEEKIDQLLKLQ